MLSTSIVFTGLVKGKEPKLLNNLNQHSQIFHRMILSTWKGQLTKGFKNDISRFKNLEIIEADVPLNPGRGNINCQMKSFENGLDKINEPTELVLKARTDFLLTRKFATKLLASIPKHFLEKTLGGPFVHKVWVPWIEITKPFYVADEFFMGYSEDLRFLINYNASYDTRIKNIGHGITHIRRFIDPFMKYYPALEEYLDCDDSLVRMEHPDRFSKLDKNLDNIKDYKYLKFLAIYFHIFYKYFRVNLESKAMITNQPYAEPRMKLDPLTFRPNFASSKSFFKTRIFCYDDIWLKNLAEGKMIPDYTYEAVMELTSLCRFDDTFMKPTIKGKK